MADVEIEKVPPVPNAVNIVAPEGTSNKITIPWLQWFNLIREKINIINESLVGLANLVGTGILARISGGWVTRTIQGTALRISVANGDGISGDPTVDFIDTGVTPGAYTNLNATIGSDGRVYLASSGSGGGGSGGGEILVSDTNTAPPVMLTNEAEDDFVYSD